MQMSHIPSGIDMFGAMSLCTSKIEFGTFVNSFKGGTYWHLLINRVLANSISHTYESHRTLAQSGLHPHL